MSTQHHHLLPDMQRSAEDAGKATLGAEYYKGLVSSDLQQRYSRKAEESSDADMLARNLQLAGYATALLAVLVAAFLASNGLLPSWF